MKWVTVLFSICFVVLILLLSYFAMVGIYSFDVEQRSAMDFLSGDGVLEGYSDSEVSHMEDVRNVMLRVEVVFYLMLLVCSLVLTFYRRELKKVSELLKYGGISVVGIIGLIGIVGWLAFDWLFEKFHLVFFPQGNWQFAAGSKLISVFPLDFFVGISGRIFAFAVLLGIVAIVVSRRLAK